MTAAPRAPNYPAEAAMKCAEPAFQSFLRDVTGCAVTDKDSAAAALRGFAEVKSRREFGIGEIGRVKWRKVRIGFGYWQSGVGFKNDPDRLDPLKMGLTAHQRGTAQDRNPFDARDNAHFQWDRGWTTARRRALTDVYEIEGEAR